jgi:hypothetical protein
MIGSRQRFVESVCIAARGMQPFAWMNIEPLIGGNTCQTLHLGPNRVGIMEM